MYKTLKEMPGIWVSAILVTVFAIQGCQRGESGKDAGSSIHNIVERMIDLEIDHVEPS